MTALLSIVGGLLAGGAYMAVAYKLDEANRQVRDILDRHGLSEGGAR